MRGNMLTFGNPEDKTSCIVLNLLKAENQRSGGSQRGESNSSSRNRKGSGHSTGGNNHDFCLVIVKFKFVGSHPVLYVVDAEPHRVNEVRKAIRSSRVLELGVIGV